MKKSDYMNLALTFIFGLIAVYFGLHFGVTPGGASPVWPATGIYVGIVSLFGPIHLLTVFLSYFLGKASFNGEVLVALGLALNATFQAFIGSYLLSQWRANRESTSSTFGQVTLAHILIAVLIGLFSSVIGSAILFFAGHLSEIGIVESGIVWAVGDGIGYLFFAPLIISLHASLSGTLKVHWKKAGGILALALASAAVFFLPSGEKYLIIVFLIQFLMARLGNNSDVLKGSGIIYFVAIASAAYGAGPFRTGDKVSNIMTFQVILFVIVTFGLGIFELQAKNLLRSSKFILPVTMAIGWVLFTLVFQAEVRKDHQRFDELIKQFEAKVEVRMQAYIDGLRGGRSLMLSGVPVTPALWRKYVSELDIVNRYPGINGIGTIKRIAKSDFQKYLSFTKRHLLPEFEYKIVPDVVPPDSAYHDIIYMIEPTETNIRAMGLDIASEANRQFSANLALATGKAAMSRRIILIQDNNKRPGFLLFLPVHSTNESMQRASLQNFLVSDWIYAPFVTEKFLEVPVQEAFEEIRMIIYDTDEKGKKLLENVLFANEEKIKGYEPQRRDRILNIAQQKWFVSYSTTPKFLSSNHAFSLMTLVLSLFVSLALAGMVGSIRWSAGVAETRAKELSEKIIYTSKLAALGEMASGLAHELNNPLTIIVGSGERLKRHLRASEQVQSSNILPIVEKTEVAVHRMAKIVKSLVDFSTDSVASHLRTTSLEEIPNGALQLVRQKFLKANIEIRESRIPNIQIECHSLQIVQVLYNLLSNAYDAVIDLPEKWVELEYLVSSKNIEIRVTDSGTGIPKAIAAKLMQPFFTTKAVGKGTGMGLSESKGIIEAHGGEIYLDSAAKNTTFVIRLPLKAAALSQSA